MALLVFKTSVGFARTPGGFDPHSPPPFFQSGALINNMTRTLPRRAVFAALAAFFGLFLLVHGYTRPGLLVIGKKVVEVKLPPEPGLPEDVPAWIEKPPTTQKVIEDFTATVPEWEAMVRVTVGAIARTAGGALMVTEMNAGSPRCPT